MDKILGSSLGLILVALSAIMVVAIPTNVVALVENRIGHFEDIVYVSASSSSNNTAKESSGESNKDSSAVVSLITISKGPQGNTVFNPQTTTIKTGGEILILNNDTVAHTIKNGMGPDDPLSGKLFGVGPINPSGFIEYVASNLQPGTYPFYSTSNPSIKGELVVTNR